MSYYRLYFMDGLSGHVTSFVEIEAKTDADAIDEAETHREHVAMELWCGRKKVKRWPPNFGSTPPEPRPTFPIDRTDQVGAFVKSSPRS